MVGVREVGDVGGVVRAVVPGISMELGAAAVEAEELGAAAAEAEELGAAAAEAEACEAAGSAVSLAGSWVVSASGLGGLPLEASWDVAWLGCCLGGGCCLLGFGGVFLGDLRRPGANLPYSSPKQRLQLHTPPHRKCQFVHH